MIKRQRCLVSDLSQAFLVAALDESKRREKALLALTIVRLIAARRATSSNETPSFEDRDAAR